MEGIFAAHLPSPEGEFQASQLFFPLQPGTAFAGLSFFACAGFHFPTELPAADRREVWAGLAQDATKSWAVESGPGFNFQHCQVTHKWLEL